MCERKQPVKKAKNRKKNSIYEQSRQEIFVCDLVIIERFLIPVVCVILLKVDVIFWWSVILVFSVVPVSSNKILKVGLNNLLFKNVQVPRQISV